MATYPAAALASFPWIVSSGTMRPADLADAYLGAVDTIADLLDLPRLPEAPAGIGNGDLQTLQRLAVWANETVSAPATDDEWEALSSVEGWLGSRAPEGFYFGSQEGDGACYGFWLSDEWAEALEERGLSVDDPAATAELIQALTDEGLTPDNLCDGLAGMADGWTAEQAGANYCQELAEDCGMIPDGLRWPLTCIDWEQAWRELRMGDGYSAIRNPGAGADWLILRPV